MRTLISVLTSISILLLLDGCHQQHGLTPGEGYIDVTGGKVWYRINGSGDKTPMLLLHGGPGSSSYYLDPLKPLSKDRPVIFIDQLGSGRSARITDTTLMTIENYVEQVEQVRKALGLQEFYLYGHSWGTMLGIDYYLKYPSAIKAIIFHSPLFSTALWLQDADTLVSTLPDSVQQAIRVSVQGKSFNDPGYVNAVNLFYSKFLWRKERSQTQIDSGLLMDGTNVYQFMWGPSEFTATGNLLHYDRVGDLHNVKVPTLLLAGEFDEARPGTVKYFQRLIPGAAFTMISNAGHDTMHDNLPETLAALEAFLIQADQKTGK